MSERPVKPLTHDQAIDLIESLKKIFNWNDDAQKSQLWFQIGLAIHQKVEKK